LLVLLGLAAAWIAWGNRSQAIAVRTTVARPPSSRGETTLLNASGYVTARREATVSSKVTGKVEEVLVEEGMLVAEGQVLARLDVSNVHKSLQLAEAQVTSTRKAQEETRAQLHQAKRELRRVSQLAREQIASPSELDRVEAEAAGLQARLERQQADVAVVEQEVALWRQQMDDTIIRAPFAGVVTSKNAQPGEMISPMSAGGSFTRTGICTIVDMSSLEIEVDVSESYINRVSAGQPVDATLDSYPDWHIPSQVIAIIPTADRQKATVRVRVGFEKLDPRILPEMSVKVAFQGTNAPSQALPGVSLPKSAVRRSDGRDRVWLVREGRLEGRDVTIAGARGDDVIVAAGIQGGDRVVVAGPDDLAEGAQVTESKP
jgi:RND family efflux transporter MFP subunit